MFIEGFPEERSIELVADQLTILSETCRIDEELFKYLAVPDFERDFTDEFTSEHLDVSE